MNATPDTMDLTDDEKDWIRRIVRRSGSVLSPSDLDTLFAAISRSMSMFEAERSESPYARASHDQLRAIWKLVTKQEPPVIVIRARLKSLPESARIYVERRATRVLPDLFPSPGNFIGWTQSAEANDLLEKTRLVVAEGARSVEGRRRGNGRRSKSHIEPMIMGVTRGTGQGLSEGGRPPASAIDRLVMYLALDWANATGATPTPGRGDAEPYGDLVHQVFGWLDQQNADQALRRYWEAVQREAARSPGGRKP